MAVPAFETLAPSAQLPQLPRWPNAEPGTMMLPISIPSGIDPATLPSLVKAIEQAFVVMDTAGVVQRADLLAELATGFVQPDLELVEDRVRRMQTVQAVFAQGEWLTAEQINALQSTPPANKAHPASDWKRRGRVFSVNYGGKEYFARYQFDALYQPLPVVKEVLAAYGEVADSWTLAAWFHFPNGWLMARREPSPLTAAEPHIPLSMSAKTDGADVAGGNASAQHVAPKDALNRRADVVRAAARRLNSYAA